MIITVGSDKGSPGATTLATVLGLVWPGDRVVCELDTRGADLPFRLTRAGGGHMSATPSVVSLAIDTRSRAGAMSLASYAQPTALGVPVIRGEVSAKAMSKLAPHIPAITSRAASWSGTVIADLGCLQPNNPSLVVARASAAVLLVTRASTEGLGHLRERVEELGEYVGDPTHERTTVGVVVVTDPRDERGGVSRARELLTHIGSPAPVVGAFIVDSAAAGALWTKPLSKKLVRTPLVRSAESLVREMWRLWPELGRPQPSNPAQLPSCPDRRSHEAARS